MKERCYFTQSSSVTTLLTFFLSCFVSSEAQWVLDNRCARRRNLFESRESLLPPQQHELEQVDLTPVNTTGDNQGGVWYHNLRGRRRPRAGDTITEGRDLFQEDTSSFMMRLHWQKGNCWQGEWIERKWCMECEFGENCRAGNKLWTQFCSNSVGQQFVWIPNLDYSDNLNYGSLKLVHFDLCLERMTTNTYQMQKCDPDSSSQVLVGWNPSSAFELHPVQAQSKCINQHHHPREEEDIANTACATAAKHHTNLWRVYKNDNAGNEMSRLRRPECTERNPCDMCQGDCDNDDQCEGDLVCYQRGNEDFYMPVPGCTGIPNMGSDYCTSLENLFAPRIPNNGLRVRDPECSPSNPCRNACEGDCDSDNDCFGTMKCFQRGDRNDLAEDEIEEVPGCMATEYTSPQADFCYQPDGTGDDSSKQNALEVRDTECSEERPCLQCQGDCDGNRDCYGPLECFQRKGGEAVPGCPGSAKGEVDYCYLPEGVSLPTLAPIVSVMEEFLVIEEETTTQNGGLEIRSVECSEDSPCLQCQGDCDGNQDCLGPLECFQRRGENSMEAVPGCQGSGRSGVDYCYLPEGSTLPTTTETEIEEKEVNEDVAEELVNPDDTHVMNEDESLQLKDYTRTCTEYAPCQLCEGDCDTDIDCESTLICFQRRFSDPLRDVPGCPGRGVAGGDYCIEP